MSSEKLKDHIDYVHSEFPNNTKKTNCDECNWIFSNTDKLEKHQGLIHSAKNNKEEIDNDDQPEDVMKQADIKQISEVKLHSLL